MKRKRSTIAASDIDQAVAIWCEEARANKAAYRGYRHAIPHMTVETPRSRIPRQRLGRLLLRRYSKETGDSVTGPRWDQFREWLKEHMHEINFARLVVAILTLLVLL